MNIITTKLEIKYETFTLTLVYDGEKVIIEDTECRPVLNPDLNFRKQIYIPYNILEQFLKLIEVT